MIDKKRPDATGKIPNRRLKTVSFYRKRGDQYVNQVRREITDPGASLCKVVDVFLVSNGRYKLSSQRAIKAWLLQLIDDACACDPSDCEMINLRTRLDGGCGPALVAELQYELGHRGPQIGPVIDAYLAADGRYTIHSQRAITEYLNELVQSQKMSGTLATSEAEILLARLRSAENPKSKRARRRKNTSANKRKSIPATEFRLAVRYLCDRGDDDNIAASLYLTFGMLLGIRPGEWRTAWLDGSAFNWAAEKTGNGRGNVEKPKLQLDWPDKMIAKLRWFLNYVKVYCENDEAWNLFIDRLRSRIAYACSVTGIKRISPYITRDIFIATELLAGTDPAEVAAKVNHKSSRTQRRHYASKASGFHMVQTLTSVDRACVATVAPIEPFSFDKVRDSRPQPLI
jgi:integrase